MGAAPKKRIERARAAGREDLGKEPLERCRAQDQPVGEAAARSFERFAEAVEMFSELLEGDVRILRMRMNFVAQLLKRTLGKQLSTKVESFIVTC